MFGGKTAHRTSPVQPNCAAGSQQEHRPLSRHAEIGDHLSSTLSTDLLQAIFSLRATWLLSYDLNCSRPFACLCRGHSSVRVERPCKRQPHIAKTTQVCAALIIRGCDDLCSFSRQRETHKHVNNFVHSQLHGSRKSPCMDCTGAPAVQSLLGDLGFLISLQKSELSRSGGRGGKRDDYFELPKKL